MEAWSLQCRSGGSDSRYYRFRNGRDRSADLPGAARLAVAMRDALRLDPPRGKLGERAAARFAVWGWWRYSWR